MALKAAAQTVRSLLSPREWRVRVSLLLLFKKQRKELPLQTIRESKGASAWLIKKWNEEFVAWYKKHDPTWKRLWFKSIANTQIMGGTKTVEEDAYEKAISARALVIGAELANANAEAVGAALDVYSQTSWTKMASKLKEVIGLQPGQVNALAKAAVKLRDAYPPKQAQAMIDRLYKKKLNYRAQLIARNEMSTVVNEAQRQGVADKMKRGVLPKMEKRWSTIGDNKVSEGCQINEAEGWIPFDQPFTSGHMTSPRFPGCRCGVQYREVKRIVPRGA